MNTVRTDFINRELSWLDFNSRVLSEAQRTENPISERLRFLAITSSNLDEFFMVRVAGTERRAALCADKQDASGYTPSELLSCIAKKVRKFVKMQYICFGQTLKPELSESGFIFLKPGDMNAKQKRFIAAYYDSVIFPILTPIADFGARRFPHISGRSLNIAVKLSKKECAGFDYAIVRAPSNIPRFLELPSHSERAFVLLEDIMIYRMDALFDAHRVKSCTPFRITRNSDVEIDDDAPDLLIEVKKSIKKRKTERPVRLELPNNADTDIKNFLTRRLKLKKHQIYKCQGPLDLTFLSKFAGICAETAPCFKPIVPVNPPADFVGCEDIFEAIKKRDRLVCHPYESFNCVIDFMNKAAEDENVLAIKQTLYRVSGNSPVIDALIKAAENGKQVTVLVELKARFDEENNVSWAQKLEAAGCHVIYGVRGLKTHCKILSVVRKEGNLMRTYLHMATGNYNDSTAKQYTDIGMFTCRSDFAKDAAAFFNMLTGGRSCRSYRRFVAAPGYMRRFFEERIENEIENAKLGNPCGIFAKVNSLVDTGIISLLYKASQSGVPIRLIVRGICCLIPGRENLSENIEVYSIIGQLLEHSRIFRFENGGKPRIWLGSADLMPRNLNRRVELVFPVSDKRLAKRIDKYIGIMLDDTHNLWRQQSDGTYCRSEPNDENPRNSQRELASEASAAAKKSRHKNALISVSAGKAD